MPEYLNVTATFPSKESAQASARLLVAQRLAASAQVAGPINSTYWWQDEICEAVEWLILVKTTGRLFDQVKQCIEANHAYELPEIYATPIIAADETYLAWISQYASDRVG